MVICLEQGADLHMAQLMPLPLTVSCFSKIQMVLPFWYRFTRVVPDKGPLNVCIIIIIFLVQFRILDRSISHCRILGKPCARPALIIASAANLINKD